MDDINGESFRQATYLQLVDENRKLAEENRSLRAEQQELCEAINAEVKKVLPHLPLDIDQALANVRELVKMAQVLNDLQKLSVLGAQVAEVNELFSQDGD